MTQHFTVPLEVRIKPVETLLFRSDLVAVGQFRCPAGHPLFVDSGPCSNNTFVFPRTATKIRHASGVEFTGGPNTISIYNEGQRYTRSAVDAADHSDWFAVSRELVAEFRHAHAPSDARIYFEQRSLFTALERKVPIDAATVEEGVVQLLGRVLLAASGRPSRRGIARGAVEHAKAIIASDVNGSLPLRELAREVGLSPYQLCRDFRALSGMTMTRYRHSLRLRMALERLDGNRDLTALALDLGYSSHSHFTYAFRREFGVSPSVVRSHRHPAALVV